MIKYECDVCGVVNNPSDTYGPGVAPEGRPFKWFEPGKIKKINLEIWPSLDGASASHVCGKCLGKALRKAVDELWPVPKLVGDPVMGKHMDGIFYPHWPGIPCAEPGSCELISEVVNYATITPGSDSSGSDMREMRSEPEVPGSSALIYHSPGTGPKEDPDPDMVVGQENLPGHCTCIWRRRSEPGSHIWFRDAPNENCPIHDQA